MARPAELDPPELQPRLWEGFGGETGYDVGANYGQSVEIMLSMFGRVVAFEPSPAPFEALQAQWGDRSPSVTLCQIAVSSDNGQVRAAELDDGQYAYTGTHGLTEASQLTRTAQCRDLDSLAAEHGYPDFVKVDTEGHEYHILLGARGLITHYWPDWLIEFHNRGLRQSCLGILETLGSGRYEIETVRHPHYAAGSDNWHDHGWIRARAR